MITDNDPAGMGIAFTNAINRYTDHACRLITTQERYGLGFEKDIHIPDINDDDFGEVEQLLKDADILHFHVFKDENSHLGPLIIRDYIKGKEIIHHHHGHPDFLINVDLYNQKYKKLGRKVIVSTPDLLKITENTVWIPNIVPIYDVQFLPRYENSLQNNIVKICQSPTRKFHKHTGELKSVLSELVKRGLDLEILIIEKTPYFECLRLKSSCNIIFDHMRGWFGIASLESLSHGKPVIAGLDNWNIQCIKEFTGSEKLPWLIARNKEELSVTLKDLVNDKDLRQSTGESSRMFMEKYWTEQKALSLLLNEYNGL